MAYTIRTEKRPLRGLIHRLIHRPKVIHRISTILSTGEREAPILLIQIMTPPSDLLKDRLLTPPSDSEAKGEVFDNDINDLYSVVDVAYTV